jgi:hypothetical protein
MPACSTPEKEHLRQITQAELVTQAPEDNERDDIGRILGAIQGPASSFVELLAAVATTEPPVTLSREFRPLRNRCPAAGVAFHPPRSLIQQLSCLISGIAIWREP